MLALREELVHTTFLLLAIILWDKMLMKIVTVFPAIIKMMPSQQGTQKGLQLWINLSSRHKIDHGGVNVSAHTTHLASSLELVFSVISFDCFYLLCYFVFVETRIK